MEFIKNKRFFIIINISTCFGLGILVHVIAMIHLKVTSKRHELGNYKENHVLYLREGATRCIISGTSYYVLTLSYLEINANICPSCNIDGAKENKILVSFISLVPNMENSLSIPTLYFIAT